MQWDSQCASGLQVGTGQQWAVACSSILSGLYRGRGVLSGGQMWALEHPGGRASWLEGMQGCTEAGHLALALLGTHCFREGELGALRPQEGIDRACTPPSLPGPRVRGCPTACDSGSPAMAAASQEARACPQRPRAGTCRRAKGFSPL